MKTNINAVGLIWIGMSNGNLLEGLQSRDGSAKN